MKRISSLRQAKSGGVSFPAKARLLARLGCDSGEPRGDRFLFTRRCGGLPGDRCLV